MDDLPAVLSRLGKGNWHISASADDSVTWLPLIPVSHTGMWLGVDAGANWILGRLSGRVVSSGESLPPSWLTVLDTDEQELRASLARAAESHGLPAEVLQSRVPVDDILTMALRSNSRHWTERATHWLLGRQLRQDQVSLLRDLTMAAWASQRARQTAQRLLRSHEASDGG